MSYQPGPKELAQRVLHQAKIEGVKKPSKADLRKNIAKIKPVTRHGGKRGR